MLFVSPSTRDFPEHGTACIYLFKIRPDIVKIGMTIDLTKKQVKYRQAECLAYCSPVFNARKAERFAIQKFASAFPRFTGNEWFRADPKEAQLLFLRLFQFSGDVPGVLEGTDGGKLPLVMPQGFV